MELDEGEAASVPEGAAFSWENRGEEPAELLIVGTDGKTTWSRASFRRAPLLQREKRVKKEAKLVKRVLLKPLSESFGGAHSCTCWREACRGSCCSWASTSPS